MKLLLHLTLVQCILGGISHSGSQEQCLRTEHQESMD